MLGVEQILDRVRAIEQRTRTVEDSVSAEIEAARQLLQELEKRTAETVQTTQRQDSDLSGLRSALAERVQQLEAALGAGEVERGLLSGVIVELKAGNAALARLLDVERSARTRLEAVVETEAALRTQIEERVAGEERARAELASGLSNEAAARMRVEAVVANLEAGRATLRSQLDTDRVAGARLEAALRAQIEERVAGEQRARAELASIVSNEAVARTRIEALVAGLESNHATVTSKIEVELGTLRELAEAHRGLESRFAKELGEREALAARLQEEQAARRDLADSVTKALDLQRAVDELRAAADGERAARGQAIAGLSIMQEEAATAMLALHEALESHRSEVSGRFEGIGSEVGGLVASVREQARQSVDVLGQRLAGMETALVSMREQGAALETRLSNLSGGLEEASQARVQINATLQELSERTAKVDGALQGLHGAREQLRSLEQYIKHVDSQITRIDTKSARQDNVNRSTLLRLFASERQAEVRIPVVSFARSAALPLGNLCRPGNAETADVYFICSHGRTATHWLTAVLNAHPDFIAAHGPTSPPHLIGSRHYRAELVKADPVGRPEAFQSQTVTAMRDEMKLIGSARYYVRIHGLSFAHLYSKMSNEAPDCRVRAINVVRHPIPRAQSFWMHWRMQEDGRRHVPSLMKQWDEESIYRGYEKFVSTRYPKVDLKNSDVRLFLMAIHWVTRDFDDFVLPAEHFPIEWLLQGWKQFEAFLNLTFGQGIEGRQALQKAYRELPRLNAMATKPQTPAQIYGGWEPWQRAAFATLCEDQQLPAIYARFGYDFSFLKKSGSTT